MNLIEVRRQRIKRSYKLRALRKSKGITQHQMAILSGLSWPTVIRIEGGKVEWRIDSEIIYCTTLRKITKEDILKVRELTKELNNKKT
jgi:DNA-binding XRE family transcriptional regulator